MTAGAALFALLVIGFVSQSGRVRRAHLTAPILFVAAGIVVGLVVTGRVDRTTTRLLAEVTLALLLFHDAAQLKPRELRADLRLTSRLLLVGLPSASARATSWPTPSFRVSVSRWRCSSRRRWHPRTPAWEPRRWSTPWFPSGCVACSTWRAD